jgi:hypothetical protein
LLGLLRPLLDRWPQDNFLSVFFPGDEWFLLGWLLSSHSSLAGLTYLIKTQAAFANSKVWPRRTPYRDVWRTKVQVQCRLVSPHLFDMDKPGFANVFGITILLAAILSAAGSDHPLHDWAGFLQLLGRQADCSDD